MLAPVAVPGGAAIHAPTNTPPHVAALEQHQVERQLRNLAGAKPDHQEAPRHGDRPQARFRIGAADRIVDTSTRPAQSAARPRANPRLRSSPVSSAPCRRAKASLSSEDAQRSHARPSACPSSTAASRRRPRRRARQASRRV